jgi:hypothetical protein
MPQGYGNKQVNIRIEPELLKQIEDKAGEAKISPADWIRNAIRLALGETIPGAITRLEFEAAIAGLDERLARLELAGAKQLLANDSKPVDEQKPKKLVEAKFTPTPKDGDPLPEPEPVKPKPKGEKKSKPRYEPISLDGGLDHKGMWELCGGTIGSVRTASSLGQIKWGDGKPYQYFKEYRQWLQVDMDKEISAI